MTLDVAEVLEEWRRAERILELLPRTAPERASIAADVELLRATYHRLTTSTIPLTSDRIDISLRHLEQISARLAEIHAKYAANHRVDGGHPSPAPDLRPDGP